MRGHHLLILGALGLATGCGPRAVVRIGGGGDVTREVAEGRGAEAEYERAEARLPRAWLWRVEGCGVAAPSYLFGTMHVGVRFADALPAPLDRALYDARIVLAERDFRLDGDGPFVTPEDTEPDRPLDELLGPRLWGNLREIVAGEIPDVVLRRLRPGAVSLYVSDVLFAEAHAAIEARAPVPGRPTTVFLDQAIQRWAIAMDVPIVGLETVADVRAALDASERAPGAPLDALVRVVRDPAASRAAVERAMRAYLELDAETLREADGIRGAGPGDPILEGRNRAWMTQLLAELRAGNVFVAVGLAHLVGPVSVLDLLHEERCTTERVLGDGGFVAGDRPPVLVE